MTKFLFFHGLGNDSTEFNPLRLRGIPVVPVRVFSGSSAYDWVEEACTAYKVLKDSDPTGTIYMGGSSAGALLAIIVAARMNYAKTKPLFIFSPAVSLKFGRAFVIKMLYKIFPNLIVKRNNPTTLARAEQLTRLQHECRKLMGFHKAECFCTYDDPVVSTRATIEAYPGSFVFVDVPHALIESDKASDFISKKIEDFTQLIKRKTND